MNPPTAGWESGRVAHITIRGDVVELPLSIRIEEPIQPGSEIVQLAAIDALVVQIQVVVTRAHLPSAAPAIVAAVLSLHPKEVLEGLHAIERHSLQAVVVALSRQEIEQLHIPAVVGEVRDDR